MANLGGFSWKRLIGLSGLLGRTGRQIGMPLSESGRERQIGGMITQEIGQGVGGRKGMWIVSIFLLLLMKLLRRGGRA